MNKPEKELAHSFNVILSSEISQKLGNEQDKLVEKIREQRNYDSSPHLSIATKFMPESQTEAFKAALLKEFRNDISWNLEFAGFSISTGKNYLFLNLSNDSRQKLFELHERAFTATENIGNKGQGGLPPKYTYDPHISLIKLLPEDSDAALKLVGDDFAAIKMRILSYEITRQEDTENGFSNFPVLERINLK